jgi:hypothetical protein
MRPAKSGAEKRRMSVTGFKLHGRSSQKVCKHITINSARTLFALSVVVMFGCEQVF